MTNLPPESTIEQLGTGLTRQMLDAGTGGQIVIFSFTDVAPETVDLWMSVLHATIESWPPDQPYLALYDLSDIQDSIRRYEYAFNQMRAFRQTYPDLVTRIACILQNSLLGELSAQALQLFAYAVGRDYVRVEIFFKRADGLHWLEQFTAP